MAIVDTTPSDDEDTLVEGPSPQNMVQENFVPTQTVQNNTPQYHLCDGCNVELYAIRYHCTVCNDFDLCQVCKKKFGHTHLMVKLSPDITEPDLVVG